MTIVKNSVNRISIKYSSLQPIAVINDRYFLMENNHLVKAESFASSIPRIAVDMRINFDQFAFIVQNLNKNFGLINQIREIHFLKYDNIFIWNVVSKTGSKLMMGNVENYTDIHLKRLDWIFNSNQFDLAKFSCVKLYFRDKIVCKTYPSVKNRF
jgi:hypothetical protein